jgi:hypothetical protein
MKRRTYAFDARKCKIADPVLVAIDLHGIVFSWFTGSSPLFREVAGLPRNVAFRAEIGPEHRNVASTARRN